MALDIEKKKHTLEAPEEKSKGLNAFLWLLTVVIIVATAFGNIYFEDQYSTPIRVVAVVVLLLIALGIAAMNYVALFGQAARKQRKPLLLLWV